MEQIYAARYVLPISAAPIEGGAILVRDGRILAAGRRDTIRSESPSADCHDFGDAVLLPPLVNAHTHLELTLFPEWSGELGDAESPASFVDWILQVIRIKRSVHPDRYAASVKEGIRRSLAAGTGAVGDVLSCFSARHAYAESPLRGRLFLEALGRDPARNRAVLQGIADLLREERAGRMEWGIAPHSPYTVSAAYLEEIFDLIRRSNVYGTIHLGESAEESAFLQRAEGPLAETLYPHVGWGGDIPLPANRSPVAYLEEHGGLDSRILPVHGVQVGEEDADRLARAGCSLVLCPRSNVRLDVGVPPLEMYRRKGVPLALGTDSLASCDTLSIWDEIAFARDRLPGADPSFLLEAATLGGAKALGLGDGFGSLKPGARADFQVLRPLHPPARGDVEEYLCAPGRTGEVSALFLNGRDVLGDEEIAGISECDDML